MVDANFIESLAKQLDAAIPDGLKKMHQQTLEQFKQILQSQLTKLDLVSRQEFDIQAKLLEQSIVKINQLEEKIKQLEQVAQSKQN